MLPFLIPLLAAKGTSAEDPYQSIGIAIGDIYSSIGAAATATDNVPEEVYKVQREASVAIESLRSEAGNFDWNTLLGPSVASVYTSQLTRYLDGIASFNNKLEVIALPAPTANEEAIHKEHATREVHRADKTDEMTSATSVAEQTASSNATTSDTGSSAAAAASSNTSVTTETGSSSDTNGALSLALGTASVVALIMALL